MSDPNDLPRLVGSETVLDHRYLTLRLDTVRDAAGREFTYIHGTGPRVVYAVPVWDDGTVTLLQQVRYGMDGRSIEIPGGHCEDTESPERGAARELLEETGLTAARLSLLTECLATVKVQQPLSFFLAEGLVEGEALPDADEDIELLRIPMTDAVDLALCGGIRNGPTIIGLLAAAEALRRR